MSRKIVLGAGGKWMKGSGSLVTGSCPSCCGDGGNDGGDDDNNCGCQHGCACPIDGIECNDPETVMLTWSGITLSNCDQMVQYPGGPPYPAYSKVEGTIENSICLSHSDDYTDYGTGATGKIYATSPCNTAATSYPRTIFSVANGYAYIGLIAAGAIGPGDGWPVFFGYTETECFCDGFTVSNQFTEFEGPSNYNFGKGGTVTVTPCCGGAP